MEFLKDPRFWGPAFGFLTAFMGFIRWLLRVSYVYKKKSDDNKAKNEASVEKLKEHNMIRMTEALRLTVDKMKPTIDEHSKILTGFRHSFDLMQVIEGEAVTMMRELKIQYGNFTSEIMKFNAIGDNILGRMEKIETEVLQLKKGSPNLFVTTKK